MEYEIKLAPVLPHQAAALWADGMLAPYLGPLGRIRMHSRYYDTPHRALGQGGYTLRLRQEDGVRVCAFKGPAEGNARLELETGAETLADGMAALLDMPQLPVEAADILRQGGFEEIAQARFVRETAVYRRGDLRFHLCYDLGEAVRGARSGTIAQIELELISGQGADLDALAEDLRSRHGLSMGGQGKLQQALALGEGDAGRAVSPFFVSNELLNYCVRMGWLTVELDAQKRLHYRLTPQGSEALPARFGVDFGKPCALAGEA